MNKNNDGLESPMLHTNIRGSRSTSSGEEDFEGFFTIYGRGSHLGHVTSIMSSNFHFLVFDRFLTTFGSEVHSSF